MIDCPGSSVQASIDGALRILPYVAILKLRSITGLGYKNHSARHEQEGWAASIVIPEAHCGKAAPSSSSSFQVVSTAARWYAQTENTIALYANFGFSFGRDEVVRPGLV